MAEIALNKLPIKNKQTKKPQLTPAVWTGVIALSTYVKALIAENKNSAENYKERINSTTQQFMVDFFQQGLEFSRHMVTGTSGSDPINDDIYADASPTKSSSTVPSYRLSVNHNSLRCLEVNSRLRNTAIRNIRDNGVPFLKDLTATALNFLRYSPGLSMHRLYYGISFVIMIGIPSSRVYCKCSN
ncbi:hypothetical protein AB4K20DRAFT_1864476 [Rhizopus microsporus]|uniref:Uncharacterized protein n=1 Tax=Rhizopus microsporus TaxID=58291 RepID=A0A1X0S9U3_RHIZD|nr:hypothetical protein BCV71DRAFT_232590 [Rhizopus microsporus]